MKNNIMVAIDDIVEMKKPHACGSTTWTVIRLGADLKLKCTKCNHEIMMDRLDFNKKLKKKVEKPNG